MTIPQIIRYDKLKRAFEINHWRRLGAKYALRTKANRKTATRTNKE